MTLIALSHQEVIALMTRGNIACSVDTFERALLEAQTRALVLEVGPLRAREAFERAEAARREAALNRMAENARELGLDYMEEKA